MCNDCKVAVLNQCLNYNYNLLIFLHGFLLIPIMHREAVNCLQVCVRKELSVFPGRFGTHH